MATELVGTFEQSLDALELTARRTTSETFHEDTVDALVEPAVGAPLPFDDLDLPDAVQLHPTPTELRAAKTGVTGIPKAVAEYGTLVIQSLPGGDEPVSLYPNRHVAVLRASDLVPDLATCLAWLGDEVTAGRDSAVLATGPSATADMGELVRGVHGPRDVHVVIVTDR